MFVGDGANDAPALAACAVGLAFGPNSDAAAEAAGAVAPEASPRRADALPHIGRRARAAARQSAVGGLALSRAGLLPPVAGAITREVIDVAAVLSALRVAFPPPTPTDY